MKNQKWEKVSHDEFVRDAEKYLPTEALNSLRGAMDLRGK